MGRKQKLPSEIADHVNQWFERHYHLLKSSAEDPKDRHPIVVANIATFNFWRKPSKLSWKAKLQYARDCVRARRTMRSEDVIGYKPHPATDARILKHLRGQLTLYYVCEPNSRLKVLLLDIDDKDGSKGDALPMARHLIQHYFPGAYLEVSTHGKGAHVYVLFSDEYCDRAKLADVCSALIPRLRPLLAKAGFKSDLDLVKGLPLEEVCHGDWTEIVKGGVPAKFPRDLLTRNQEFISAPRLTLEQLDQIARLAEPAVEIDLDSPAASDYRVATLRANRRVSILGKGKTKSGGGREVEGSKGTLYRGVEQSRYEGMSGPQKRVRYWNQWSKTHPILNMSDLIEGYRVDVPHQSTDATAQKIWRADFEGLAAKDAKSGGGREVEGSKGTLYRGVEQSRYVTFKSQPDYVTLITSLVPPLEYQWQREEKLTPQLLADFVAVKNQHAFYVKAKDVYFGCATQKATIANFKALKEKGLVTKTINHHQYRRLLAIAVKYGLLHVYEEHVPPTVSKRTGQRVLLNGQDPSGRTPKGAIVGPGPALPELQAEFLKRYNEWKAAASSQTKQKRA